MHTVQHGVNHLERLVNLFSHFRTSQNDLAANEDEKHNLRLDHSVDLERRRVSEMTWKKSSIQALQETYKTREELRLVRAEVVMTRRKALKTDWKLDIAGADDVLDLEIRKLGVKAELLDNSCVFARRQARVLKRGVSKLEA